MRRLPTRVRRFGGAVEMTSPECASGTDRVAEVARRRADVDVFVNVQGDEPEISAAAIDLAVELLEKNPGAMISTLATPIREREKLNDPACVKVVFDSRQKAMYFSRSPIPHARTWDDALLADEPAHIFFSTWGLYAYRRDFLLKLAEIPRSRIAKNLRVWSSCGCFRRGTKFWSARLMSRRLGSIRPTIIGRLSDGHLVAKISFHD